jgi:hypothetical protein
MMLHGVWWCVAVVPALRRLRQEDHHFKASLDHRVRPCLIKPKYTMINFLFNLITLQGEQKSLVDRNV